MVEGEGRGREVTQSAQAVHARDRFRVLDHVPRPILLTPDIAGAGVDLGQLVGGGEAEVAMIFGIAVPGHPEICSLSKKVVCILCPDSNTPNTSDLLVAMHYEESLITSHRVVVFRKKWCVFIVISDGVRHPLLISFLLGKP